MKRVLFAAAALVFSLAIKAQTTTAIDDVVKLNTDKHDFGKILQGKPVDFYFEITNKTEKAIVIESAQASCGCTTPEVPKEPIAPGATAKLRVQYSAAAMAGFDKTVTIKVAGIDQPKIVRIVGEVVDQANFDAYTKEQEKAKADAAVKEQSKAPEKTKAKTTKTKSKSGK